MRISLFYHFNRLSRVVPILLIAIKSAYEKRKKRKYLESSRQRPAWPPIMLGNEFGDNKEEDDEIIKNNN